jgi:23S rRNA (uracil1939-C5)-methyltransferase
VRKISAMAQFYSAKRRVTTRQIITVEATDLDPFGQGVARHNGKALFITGLLPAERAEITLTEDKRQFARGQVKRRLNDSPERVAPRCPILASAAAASNSMRAQNYSKKAKAPRWRVC